MKYKYILAFLMLALTTTISGKTRVVTATSDLAYFAREIGGDLVEVKSIAAPTADAHFVEVRPSYMMKINKADVAFKVGLELDLWFDKIIDGSRNSRLTIIDCSKYIEPLEVPTFKPDARHGDLHQFGNPHYWLGPENIEPITKAIYEGLATVDPDNASQYRQNRESFVSDLKPRLEQLRSQLQDLNGSEVVFYHNSWPYFCEFTGLVAADFVEPYPGVPPSPSHVKDLTDLVRGRSIKVIAVEPYFDKRVPNKIAEAAGARVVTLYPSVGGRDKDETYLEWLQGNIDALKDALH